MFGSLSIAISGAPPVPPGIPPGNKLDCVGAAPEGSVAPSPKPTLLPLLLRLFSARIRPTSFLAATNVGQASALGVNV